MATLLIAVSVGLIGTSFAISKPLHTEGVKSIDVAGTFTLITYGGRYFNDVETIAFLDLEGDRYTLEPYAPEFDYKIVKGLSSEDALKEAEEFASWHPDFWRSQLSRILDDKGQTIGYELRPLYHPYAFGLSDVLDIYYITKDNKVIIYIKLEFQVERQLFQSGDGTKGRGGD